MSGLCKDCKHFVVGAYGISAPYGGCERWDRGYQTPAGIKLNEVIVENDEGWGMNCGPEFGCVLFEAK